MSEIRLAEHATSKKGVRGGVLFNGKLLNLTEIARAQGLSKVYLCLIFRGQRRLPITVAIAAAAYLGMEIGDFLHAFEERLKLIEEKEQTLIKQHLDRLCREDDEDVERIRQGKPPVPRLPGLRS